MKKDVAYLEQVLTNYGFVVGALSGDVPQKQRESILNNFRTKNFLSLFAPMWQQEVSTFHVTHVIVFDHPDDHEVYVHRSGRTRAGRSGVAISLITPVEEIELKNGCRFWIQFSKMPPITEEQIAKKIRERTRIYLERHKRTLGQRSQERMRRYLPLVEELSQIEEDKELLAFLLDRYYWNQYGKN